MKFLGSTGWEMVVRRTPGQVIDRVRSNVDLDGWRFISDPGQRPILGTFGDGNFSLRCRQEGRNSFMPYLAGTIHPDSEGSRIVIRMGLHPMVRGFLVLWSCVAAVFEAPFLLIGLGGGWAGQKRISVAPAGMFQFGIALCVFGREFSKRKEVTWVSFLENPFERYRVAGLGERRPQA